MIAPDLPRRTLEEPMPEWYEGFVTFAHYNGRWTAFLWTDPPAGQTCYRVRIPIPADLLKTVVVGEVEAVPIVTSWPQP